eukprot:GHUV01018086.1.p2 GENE.GHUV01018086.1~~GHUV01018086.1.p2  ORF type:complete len:113 (+),score=11.76 GHUV01018086.1:1642-1980(+)
MRFNIGDVIFLACLCWLLVQQGPSSVVVCPKWCIQLSLTVAVYSFCVPLDLLQFLCMHVICVLPASGELTYCLWLQLVKVFAGYDDCALLLLSVCMCLACVRITSLVALVIA